MEEYERIGGKVFGASREIGGGEERGRPAFPKLEESARDIRSGQRSDVSKESERPDFGVFWRQCLAHRRRFRSAHPGATDNALERGCFSHAPSPLNPQPFFIRPAARSPARV